MNAIRAKRVMKTKVRDANKNKNPILLIKDPAQLEYECPSMDENSDQSVREFQFEGRTTNNISEEEYNFAVDLFVTNMKKMYERTKWGFDLPEKKAELADNACRFILAKDKTSGKLVGYCHYRFVMDEGRPVLYCYEIQVEKACQGMGIGKRLISLLSQLGRKLKLEHIVATVLKTNVKCMDFFKKLGFTIDESDLENNGLEYNVLSVSLKDEEKMK